MNIRVERTGRLLSSDARFAASLVSRLVGLIGRDRMEPGAALVLPGCRQVHTAAMRFPIDVIYADREWRVLRVTRNLGPWRVGARCPRAFYAIELPAGVADGVREGDLLLIDTQGCD